LDTFNSHLHEDIQLWTSEQLIKALNDEWFHLLSCELENNLNKYWKKVINHVYLLLIENSVNENKMITIPSSRHFINKLS
jgi:hypothetical protein